MVATRSILNRQEPAEGCPFCLENGRIPSEKIIKKACWGVLVHEHSQAVPGTYQIAPKWHVMNPPRWLLFLWSLFWLMRWAPTTDFNVSVNFGKKAGQTLPHPHVWLIPRDGDFAGKGLAHFVSLEAKLRREQGHSLEDLVNQS